MCAVRYLALWKTLGYETVGIRPRTREILVPPLGDQQCLAFYRRLVEIQAAWPSRPIVYHIFRCVKGQGTSASVSDFKELLPTGSTLLEFARRSPHNNNL